MTKITGIVIAVVLTILAATAYVFLYGWDSVYLGVLKLSALILHPISIGILAIVGLGLSLYFLLPRLHKKARSQYDNTGENGLTKERKVKAKQIVFWVSVLTLGSGYLLYLALRFLFEEMAENNWFVTFRTEGEHKAIMRGESAIGYLSKVENHLIDPEGFDIFKGSIGAYEAYADYLAKAREKWVTRDPFFIERKLKLGPTGEPIQENGHYQLTDELKRAIEEANSTTLFEELFGVFWIGIPPYRVFQYRFRWLQFGQKKEQSGSPSDEVDVFAREELVDSIFHRYPRYAVVIKGIEVGAGATLSQLMRDNQNNLTRTKVKIRAKLVFETITRNPHKSLFRTAALSSAGDWQQALNREIYDRVIAWLGGTDWDTLVESREEVSENLARIQEEINNTDQYGIPNFDAPISAVRDYGQQIAKISLVERELEDDSLQKAFDAVLKAQKKKEENLHLAEGEEALAAAPILGKARGLAEISKVPGGIEMTVAEHLGNINVFAPGNSGSTSLLLDVAAGKEITPRAPKPPKDSDKK